MLEELLICHSKKPIVWRRRSYYLNHELSCFQLFELVTKVIRCPSTYTIVSVGLSWDVLRQIWSFAFKRPSKWDAILCLYYYEQLECPPKNLINGVFSQIKNIFKIWFYLFEQRHYSMRFSYAEPLHKY